MSEHNSGSPNARLVKRLLLGVGGMFVFGFALVPLYDVICDVTGLNGKGRTQEQYVLSGEPAPTVDEQRDITVQFTVHGNLVDDWKFRPSERAMVVKPGEMKRISYTVTNPYDHAVTSQAIPSVAPNVASGYLNKIECFCFEEQYLEPGQTVEMPLQFFVDPELPERVSKLTLAYTLYDISDSSPSARQVASNR